MPLSLLNETDFDILEVLEGGDRNVAANVAIEIDADRNYVNTRFTQLRNEELVERVGPHDQSGLYEITEKGQVVVEHREEYGEVDDFAALVERELSQSDGGGGDSAGSDGIVANDSDDDRGMDSFG